MAPKSILKNAQPVAGPSKPRSGPKAKFSAQVSAPHKSKGKGRAPVKPESDIEESSDDNDFGDEGEDEPDTEDEIEMAQTGKEKKPTKRKRVTTAADFGATLAGLLTEPTRPAKKAKGKAAQQQAPKPSKKAKQQAAPILALSAKPLPASQAEQSLERRAARVLKAERAERLDKARIRNVVEGWTPAEGADMGSQEFERSLRKTAQRGVIKLFNAILVASKNAEAAAKTLAQQAGVKPEAPKSKKEKDNILGRGNREELTQETFLDLVRKGGAK